MKEWELDRNMFDNGEDMSSLLKDQDESEADKIKREYDEWIIEIQNT